MRALFRELRRRNVFRAALAYLALAWLIVQIVETVFPVFGLPSELVRWVIVLLAIGFPMVVAFAWFYELTSEGVMSTEAADAAGFSCAVVAPDAFDSAFDAVSPVDTASAVAGVPPSFSTRCRSSSNFHFST